MYRGSCERTCSLFPETSPRGLGNFGKFCQPLTGAVEAAPAIEYEAQAPTSSSDRLCLFVSPCHAGEYQVAGPTATSDRHCVTCPAGFSDHDSNPFSPCQKCLPGRYTAAGSTQPCAEHLCAPGTTDHDADAGTPCIACGQGHFVPEGSIGACDNYACEAGAVDNDRDASTPCDRCGPGHFIPRASSGVCEQFQCPAGTADTDSVPGSACKACDPAFGFQALPGQTTCWPARLCGPGEEEVRKEGLMAFPLPCLRTGCEMQTPSCGLVVLGSIPCI